MFYQVLVPKKGLEPPHPCEYVDLNHARLPIPPLRHYRFSVANLTGHVNVGDRVAPCCKKGLCFWECPLS